MNCGLSPRCPPVTRSDSVYGPVHWAASGQVRQAAPNLAWPT